MRPERFWRSAQRPQGARRAPWRAIRRWEIAKLGRPHRLPAPACLDEDSVASTQSARHCAADSGPGETRRVPPRPPAICIGRGPMAQRAMSRLTGSQRAERRSLQAGRPCPRRPAICSIPLPWRSRPRTRSRRRHPRWPRPARPAASLRCSGEKATSQHASQGLSPWAKTPGPRCTVAPRTGLPNSAERRRRDGQLVPQRETCAWVPPLVTTLGRSTLSAVGCGRSWRPPSSGAEGEMVPGGGWLPAPPVSRLIVVSGPVGRGGFAIPQPVLSFMQR